MLMSDGYLANGKTILCRASEADLVLHLGDGRYALIECKLGSGEIEDGASHLVELKRLIREYNKTIRLFSKLGL